MAAAYPFALPALASTAVSAGGSAEAVAWAKKGLAWLFSYHHEEATVAFNASRAAAADDGTVCPLATWGVAYCAMPDYNDGAKDFLEAHFGGVDAANAQLMLSEALAEVEQLQLGSSGGGITEPERQIIAALTARGTWGPEEDGGEDGAGCMAYALAMQQVQLAFPDNPDVCALFAESVITQAPWSLFDFQPDGHRTPRAAAPGAFECGTQTALDAILHGLEIDPEHPGLLHFLVHLTEQADLEFVQEHCIETNHCARLEAIASDASHLAHMPAHIYCLVGDWPAAIRANEIAVEKDQLWVDYHAQRVTTPDAAPENMFTLCALILVGKKNCAAPVRHTFPIAAPSLFPSLY